MKAAQDLNQANIKVGQAAKLLGVSVDTLRRWEAQGKLVPLRTPGSTRLYSLSQLAKINKSLTETNLKSKFANSFSSLNISQLFLGRFVIFSVLLLTGAAVILIAYLSLPTQTEFLQNFYLKDSSVKSLITEKQTIALSTHDIENSLPNAGTLPEVVTEDEGIIVDDESLNKSTFSAGENFEEMAKSGWTISPEDCLNNLLETGGI